MAAPKQQYPKKNWHDEEAPSLLPPPKEVRADMLRTTQLQYKNIILVGLFIVAALLCLPSCLSTESRIITTSSPTVTRKASSTLTTDLKFCTQPSVTGSIAGEMDVWYQCAGDAYDEFGKQLAKYAQEYASQHHSPSWGHRPNALPHKAKVLLFGNSNTRQIGQTLACQYAESIVNIHYFDADKPDPHMALVVEFDNGAQLFMVANSYVAHSPHWRRLLEAQIEQSLDAFDAIILGLFNPASKHWETEFVQSMVYMQNAMPATDEVSVQDYYGPSVSDIARAFRGPIQFVTLFGKQEPSRTKRASNEVIDLTRQERHNVDFLDARLYIEGMGTEGASESRLEVSQSVSNDTQAHRCTGSRGGHVDLVAWEVRTTIECWLGSRFMW